MDVDKTAFIHSFEAEPLSRVVGDSRVQAAILRDADFMMMLP